MFPPQGLVAAALQPYTLISLLLTPNVTANDQVLNAAPTASTVTAANAKSFTGTIGQIALPAITPAANGGGITLTGLNFTQGAIANVADSEAITVKHIVMSFAAGAALETGVLTQTAIDITLANQAANGANNQATGIKITGGALAGGASAYQRGIDITMAAATDTALNVATGRIVSGTGAFPTGAFVKQAITSIDANNGGFFVGQDATHGMIGNWVYNATANSAVFQFGTFNGNNKLQIQASGGVTDIGAQVTLTNANGTLHVGANTGFFTGFGNLFSAGAFSVGIGYGNTVTITDNTWKEASHFTLIGQKTSAAFTGGVIALEGEARLGAANTQNWTAAGFTSDFGLYGAQGMVITETGSTGTLTACVSVDAQAIFANAATVTNWIGFHANNPVITGTPLVNAYGVYVEAITSGSALNYAIYSAGGLNHFVGNVNTVDVYSVDGTQVVGPRQVDARINDTPNSGDATTDGIIAALQACVQTHGLMTAS